MLSFTADDFRCLNDLKDMVRTKRYDDFDALHIDCKVKGDYAVLNYRQGFDTNPHNMLARALVLRADTADVVSMSFKRFGNLGQHMAGVPTTVHVPDCDILEKMDGSLLCVSFPTGDWREPFYHTRRMLSTTDADKTSNQFGGGEDIQLLTAAYAYLHQLSWSMEDVRYTWAFELIDRVKPVITVYQPDQLGLYLIGRRCLKTYEESTEDQLDEAAFHLGSKRPRRWEALTHLSEVEAMMAQFPDDYEGFILREKITGKRAKVKKKEYLERHRMLGRTLYKNLIPVWLQGETDEVACYFPETKPKFAAIESRFGEVATFYTNVAADILAGHKDKKSLALGMQKGKVPRFTQSLVFKAFGRDVREAVEERLREAPVDTLLEVLDLKD